MKKSSRIFLAICGGLLCLCTMSSPADAIAVENPTAKNVETIKYDFLAKDEMPILGYVGLPSENVMDGVASENPSFITRSNMVRYKEAGFNILSGLYEREPSNTNEVLRALELCNELNLAYFVNDTTFRCETYGGSVGYATEEQYQAALENAWYLNEPAFAGIAVKDEPSAKDFNAMGYVNKAIKAKAEGKILYTNLFPRGVEKERLYLDNPTGGTYEQYERYVKEFVEKVKPDVLAYDCYLFFAPGGTLGNICGGYDPVSEVVHEVSFKNYFEALSLYRNTAKDNNIPFWVTVAAQNHNAKTLFTKKQINWTVNVSLAYGAKGMQYYTYWPMMAGSKVEDWDNTNRNGMVTVNGTPHDTYYTIKEINSNIKLVDSVLMQSESKGLIQFGKQILPINHKDLLYSYGLLNNVDGGDVVAGCFEHNGNDVYYIVNNSVDCGRKTFTADFVKKVNVKAIGGNLVTDQNPTGQETYDNVYNLSFNLSAGESILLEVER